MKRVIGLDVGDRSIGIAISDELWITTRGLFTISRTNIKSDTQKVMEIVKENDCSHVIIGLPVNLSGEDSKQTEKVREFAEKLKNKLLSNSMGDREVVLYDERFSTVIANREMEEAGLKKNKKREIIDQQAAAVILEDWIRTNRDRVMTNEGDIK